MGMKQILVMMMAVLLVGCGKAEEDKVVGTYERKKSGETFTVAFLENGVFAGVNKKNGKWKLVGKDVHVELGENSQAVFKIEPNGDLTEIAVIIDGKWLDIDRTTWEKIK